MCVFIQCMRAERRDLVLPPLHNYRRVRSQLFLSNEPSDFGNGKIIYNTDPSSYDTFIVKLSTADGMYPTK